MVPGELQEKEPEKEQEKDDVTKWRAPHKFGSTGTVAPWVSRAERKRVLGTMAQKPSKVVLSANAGTTHPAPKVNDTPRSGTMETAPEVNDTPHSGTMESGQQAQPPKSANVFASPSALGGFGAVSMSPMGFGQLEKPANPLLKLMAKAPAPAPSTQPTNVPEQREQCQSIVSVQPEQPAPPKPVKNVRFADNKALQAKLDLLEAQEEAMLARKRLEESKTHSMITRAQQSIPADATTPIDTLTMPTPLT
ncbi:hypothetical protein BGZ57DRAFT_968225 [Hyaloscypha finlandica]|nr:hypothetical protein BGZ57DRAFT_968225 [Hyaloscypha finlandica]